MNTVRAVKRQMAENDNTTVPEEVALWRAVIEQAFVDALGLFSNIAEIKTKRKEREHAREWLTTEGEDFMLVCELAMVSAGWVKRRFLRLEQSGTVMQKVPRRGRVAT